VASNSSKERTSNRCLLKIDSVKKNFGYRTILKSIDLSLFQSEITLLLGKNGAGKSTLMKIVSGLMRPDSGTVFYDGVEISKCPNSLRNAIGVISHSSQFYGELSAEENLLFFSRLRKIDSLGEKIKSALEKTGLKKFYDLPVKTFSSGMTKRLNIARLMISRPSILLLDEPYTGLDYDSIALFNEFIVDFKEHGGTILLISHQVDSCMDLSDKIAILEHGLISEHLISDINKPAEIVKKYQGG